MHATISKEIEAEDRRTARWVTWLMLGIVTTSPAITQGEEFINLGWITALCLTPAVLLLPGCRVWIPRIDIPAIALAVCVIIFPLLLHADTLRWSTQLYSVACCCWAMALVRVASVAEIKSKELLLFIDIIILAYFLVLIIQQLCIANGWPLFNRAAVYYEEWKLNSLMSEPSHTSFILSILIYYRGLITRGHNREKARAIAVWGLYLYVLLTTKNASAYVCIPFAVIPYISRRTWAPMIGIIGCIAILLTVLTPISGNANLRRAFRVVKAIPSLDTQKIHEADFSASVRINASINGSKAVGIRSADDWLGHGVDADIRDMPELASLELHIPPEAGIFHTWYNYGLPVAGILLWLVIAVVVQRQNPLTWLLLIPAIIQTAHPNGQLLWALLSVAIVYDSILRRGRVTQRR